MNRDRTVHAARRDASAIIVAAAVALAGVGTLASPAYAGLCGDDVNGARVACACGDVVVSDTTLRPSDPVTTQRCSQDGLFLKAPPRAASIRLDLAGLSITGAGEGSGVRVIHGGSQGAVIVGGASSSGQIVGFERGVRAHGTRALAELANVEVKGNRREGVAVRSSFATIRNVVAERNGKAGVRLDGKDSRILGVTSRENSGVGVRVMGRGVTVEAVTTGNKGDGVQVAGRAHDLSGVEAVGNQGRGMRLSGREHTFTGARVERNGADLVSTSIRGGDKPAASEATR